jgi:hypothetical protein
MTFWQAYRQSAIWCLQGAVAGLVAVIPLVVAWYFLWRGWTVTAVAVVIVAVFIGLAVSARLLQRHT